MSRFAMLTKPGGLAAVAFGILGVAALLLVLWRPVCDLSPAHAASDPAACCTTVADADVVVASDAAASGPGARAPAPIASARRFVDAPLVALVSRSTASTSLPARSFYARSGRMLL